MAKFYADENFVYPTVERLRTLGHDVLTVQEAGERGGDDPRVLAYATKDGRAVLTHNRRHFTRLHRRDPNHAGIVICTKGIDLDALAVRIHDAVAAAGSLVGKHIRVNLPP